MDLVDPILSMVLEIHSLVENVKANKKRCCRVAKRVNALEELLKSIKKRARSQISADVHQALRELKYTLESAQNLIRKYASANLVERILKSSSHGDEFSSINERLNDAFQILSGALQVEHRDILYRVFEATSRMREDEDDGKEDDAELKTMLLEFMRDQQEKTETILRQFNEHKANVENVLEMINKPSVMSEVIRMIKPQELKYSYPKEPFMKTPTSEVYKGEFHGFTVAIKRYTDLINTSPGEIRAVFNKEVETMKRFESPNILRMFGICVQDEDGPKPQFLIVMEYCEKGSLREVLDSSCKLSWTRKARMCWDAARGLYRLHQTEEKSKVHGCINSNKFLVAQGYRVKLGGFELAKTETSLKKMTKGKEIKSLCYSCPQKLSDINHPYSKDCEIYSFGIVLWEIATRKKPFDGCSSQQIYDKVCVEKCPEPLPEDCPDALGELVNACRAFESFSRPSAGVLVDKLQCMVESLEDK